MPLDLASPAVPLRRSWLSAQRHKYLPKWPIRVFFSACAEKRRLGSDLRRVARNPVQLVRTQPQALHLTDPT
jgi:hypothetical protein